MLSVSRLVRVTVNLGALPAVGRAFNILMIAGDSPVISGLERFRSYSNIAGVTADFGLNAPETKAAQLYFSQSPQPQNLMVGRWLSAATSGYNLGGILSASEQALSHWTAISDGEFKVSINGAALSTVGPCDFSAVTNLNGVATAITAALTGAVCVWDGKEFLIHSSTTGPGAAATGTVTLTGQPAPGDTLTLNGTTITFVASSPVGQQVVIGASSAATFANLLAFLQASLDTNIAQATYTNLSGQVITVTDKVPGTAGNSFALAKTGTALAVSAANLAGGSQPSSIGFAVAPAAGTDISALLKLTATTSQGLAAGFASETPAACVAALAAASSAWYGLMFAATASITTAQYLAVSDEVEALALTRMFGVTTQDSGSLSSIVTNDLGSLMKSAAYKQSMIQYSSTQQYAIASMFGRMFSVDFNAQNSTIILMYKQEPGVAPEDLDDAEANALKAKHINVYAGYDNATSIIQYGVVSSGDPIDEIWGLDWFQNAVQTSVYNLLYTSTTKIPQTDAGQNQLTNACGAVCGNQPGGAVYNGLAGPGTWKSSTVFGSLKVGQYLPLGYYIFSPSVDLQSESDRAQRKAPPIQIALKLAGGFQEADVIVTVNQ